MNPFCKYFNFLLTYPPNKKFSHAVGFVFCRASTVGVNSTSKKTIANAYTVTLPNLQFYRNKYTKKSQSREEYSDEDESIEEWDEHTSDKSSKVMSVRVGSLRADLVLKAGLGMARNKVEAAFYQSRIRLNGKKMLKKSVQVHSGDELDVIRGQSPMNPDFLSVSRIEILTTRSKEEGFAVEMKRFKSLIIENYSDPWKQSKHE